MPNRTSASSALPQEFDHAIYRALSPALARLDEIELERHFRMQGANDGQTALIVRNRSDFVKLAATASSVLEIGPLAAPALRGPNVRYFDVLDSAALREKAAQHGLDPEACPSIDYVSPTGDLSVISEMFETVFSSHVIEHQPDLVRHLADVARLLVPGGRYFLVVPDKRYCLDHFLAESTIADVLGAHFNAARLHSATAVIRLSALTTHNEAIRHWSGDHGTPKWRKQPKLLASAYAICRTRAGTYIDTHAWQFTPTAFREILEALFQLGAVPFEIERVYPTPRNNLEFYAVLRSVEPMPDLLDVVLPDGFNAAAYLAANPDVAAAGVDAATHWLEFGHAEGRKLGPEGD